MFDTGKINRNTTPTDVWNTIKAINGKKGRFGARYLRIRGKLTMNPRIIADNMGNKFKANSSNNNCSNSFKSRKEKLEN